MLSTEGCCDMLALCCQTLLGGLLKKGKNEDMKHHTDSLFVYCKSNTEKEMTKESIQWPDVL